MPAMDHLVQAIRSLRRGTASDVEERLVFGDLYPRLMRFFRTKGLAREEAEDATQEVLARVFQRADSCHDGSRFYSWVIAIARNYWLNELRRRGARKRAHIEIALDASNDGQPPSTPEITDRDGASPEHVVLGRELGRRVESAIDRLPTKCRQVFLLSLQGRSHREIATLLSIAVGTVKAHLHQARRTLRSELAENGSPAEAIDELAVEPQPISRTAGS
ncbi:MAG: RNA polymerase sigma factor [Acidobacteriota bacterium]